MKYLTPNDLIEANKIALNGENQPFTGIQYEEGLSLIIPVRTSIGADFKVPVVFWLDSILIVSNRIK